TACPAPTPPTTRAALSGLSAATTYSYTVAARDAAGNTSPNSTSVSVTIADTTPPTTPTGLTAAVAGSSGANLSWTASTDNVAVTGYIVRRNGVQVATPATTSFADTGRSAEPPDSDTGGARVAAGRWWLVTRPAPSHRTRQVRASPSPTRRRPLRPPASRLPWPVRPEPTCLGPLRPTTSE